MLSSLSSRVGRRLVFLFGVSAIVPLLGLATLSYFAVSDYLLESSRNELRVGSKSYGMSLLERLQALEAALDEAAPLAEGGELPEARRELLARYFEWLGVLEPGSTARTLVGDAAAAPADEHLLSLGSLSSDATSVTHRPVLLAIRRPTADGGFRILAGRPTESYLWWGSVGESTLPASTGVVVRADGEIVHVTLAERGTEAHGRRALTPAPPVEQSVGGHWTLPLSLSFEGEDWEIAWIRSRDDVLRPVRRFTGTFALVLTATLLGVALLALTQIRRFLEPLGELGVGVRRVARQDFSTPVKVSSGDEFEDLAKSFNGMTQQVETLIGELRRHQLGTLRSLARTMDERSPWTLGHSGRVADLCRRIAQVMALPDREVRTLYRAGLLHDIGKLRLPTELLEKPAVLTPSEFEQIQEHVEAGVRILAPIPGYGAVTKVVEEHHERLDGTGYPRGLSGDDICLGARVLAVADSFDALSSDRPYRPRFTRAEALQELHNGSGTLYDPEVLAALEVALALDPARHADRSAVVEEPSDRAESAN